MHTTLPRSWKRAARKRRNAWQQQHLTRQLGTFSVCQRAAATVPPVGARREKLRKAAALVLRQGLGREVFVVGLPDGFASGSLHAEAWGTNDL